MNDHPQRLAARHGSALERDRSGNLGGFREHDGNVGRVAGSHVCRDVAKFHSGSGYARITGTGSD
jgi:hypothetical protein